MPLVEYNGDGGHRSPWQNPYVERLIGSVRRECTDHLIILNEYHLQRILRNYMAYYHGSRTHLSLNKDAPEGRLAESAELGEIEAIGTTAGTTMNDRRDAQWPVPSEKSSSRIKYIMKI